MRIRKWSVLLLTTALLLIFAGCGRTIFPTSVTGSGKLETRDFDLTGFTGVQAAAAFVVQVDRADAYKVQVTADDNLWEVLDISVSAGTLHLQTQSGTSIRNVVKLSAVVTMPSLRKLNLSGASRANVAGFSSGDNLSVEVTGASNLAFNNVKFGATDFDVSGAGKVTGSATMTDAKFGASGAGVITLIGAGKSAAIEASGGSQVNLSGFEVQTASVNLSGGSQARVNTKAISSADLSGGAILRYTGSPTINNVQTSGGASIGKE